MKTLEKLDEKDLTLITWALLTYKDNGRCSQEDFNRTYNRILKMNDSLK